MCARRLVAFGTIFCVVGGICGQASAEYYNWSTTSFDNGGQQSALALYEYELPAAPAAGAPGPLGNDTPKQVHIEVRIATVNQDDCGLDFRSFTTLTDSLYERIDDNGAIGAVDLAVDKSGTSVVAYTNSTYTSLNFGQKAALLWVLKQLKSHANTPLRPSIATFLDGEAAIASALYGDNIHIDFLTALKHWTISEKVLGGPKIKCFSDQSAAVIAGTYNGLRYYLYDPISEDWTGDNVEMPGTGIPYFSHYSRIVGVGMIDARFAAVRGDPAEGEQFEIYGQGNSFVRLDNIDAPDQFIMAIDLAEDNDGHLYIA